MLSSPPFRVHVIGCVANGKPVLSVLLTQLRRDASFNVRYMKIFLFVSTKYQHKTSQALKMQATSKATCELKTN